MTAAMALPGNTAATFLTHFFGPGLADDDRYGVERFKAVADGDIRRCPGLGPGGEKRPAQDEGGNRHAEGGEGAAAGAHGDHRLHRAAHPQRGAILGEHIDGIPGRPPPP